MKKGKIKIKRSWIYSAAIISFTLFMLFSNSESSIRTKMRYTRELREQERLIEREISKMRRDSMILRQLMTNDDFLEKYARETFMMCEKDEIIFRINE